MGLGVRGTKGLPIAGGRGDPVKLRYLGKPVTSAGPGQGDLAPRGLHVAQLGTPGARQPPGTCSETLTHS